LVNEIVEYVNKFEKPLIALEELTHIRRGFLRKKKGKKSNWRMNSLPSIKLVITGVG
jgi:hypothetical protein